MTNQQNTIKTPKIHIIFTITQQGFRHPCEKRQAVWWPGETGIPPRIGRSRQNEQASLCLWGLSGLSGGSNFSWRPNKGFKEVFCFSVVLSTERPSKKQNFQTPGNFGWKRATLGGDSCFGLPFEGLGKPILDKLSEIETTGFCCWKAMPSWQKILTYSLYLGWEMNREVLWVVLSCCRFCFLFFCFNFFFKGDINIVVLFCGVRSIRKRRWAEMTKGIIVA